MARNKEFIDPVVVTVRMERGTFHLLEQLRANGKCCEAIQERIREIRQNQDGYRGISRGDVLAFLILVAAENEAIGLVRKGGVL